MSIESIKERIKEINAILQPLYREKDDLDRQLFDEKVKEMFNTGALIEKDWFTRQSDFKTGITLFSNTKRHTKLADLFESDYHCSTSFNDWEFCFSDGDLYLSFKDAEKALEFIKKHNLKIVLKDLKENLLELNKQKIDLELFIEKIQSTQE